MRLPWVGDLIEDLVIVGGVAPSLLIPQENVTEGHVGTLRAGAAGR